MNTKKEEHDVRASLIGSCKEVKLMLEGKKEKNSLEDLWREAEEWKRKANVRSNTD